MKDEDDEARARLADDLDAGSFTMDEDIQARADDQTKPHHSNLQLFVNKLKHIFRTAYKIISSSVGLLLLLAAYSFIGAYIIRSLELPNELAEQEMVKEKRMNIVSSLGSLSARHLNGSIDETTFELLAEELVLSYEEVLGVASQTKWTFWGSLFFCGTIYTTIGYGHITPVTVGGRVMTMVYATFGIPLALLVLADLGRQLTVAIKFLWSFVRHFYYTGYCKRLTKRGRYKLPKKQQSIEAAAMGNKADSTTVELVRVENFIDKTTVKHEVDNIPMKHKLNDVRVKHDVNEVTIKHINDVTTEHFGIENTADSTTEKYDDLALEENRFNENVSEVEDRGGSPADTDDGYEVDSEFNLPFIVAITIVVVYIILGSFMYLLWEGSWDFLRSFYFIFISISTIGLGDVIPEHPKLFLLSSIYIFIGLSLVSMCVNVAIEVFAKTINIAKEKVDQAKTKAYETIEDVGKTLDRATHFNIYGKKSYQDPDSPERAQLPTICIGAGDSDCPTNSV